VIEYLILLRLWQLLNFKSNDFRLAVLPVDDSEDLYTLDREMLLPPVTVGVLAQFGGGGGGGAEILKVNRSDGLI